MAWLFPISAAPSAPVRKTKSVLVAKKIKPKASAPVMAVVTLAVVLPVVLLALVPLDKSVSKGAAEPLLPLAKIVKPMPIAAQAFAVMVASVPPVAPATQIAKTEISVSMDAAGLPQLQAQPPASKLATATPGKLAEKSA